MELWVAETGRKKNCWKEKVKLCRELTACSVSWELQGWEKNSDGTLEEPSMILGVKNLGCLNSRGKA